MLQTALILKAKARWNVALEASKGYVQRPVNAVLTNIIFHEDNVDLIFYSTFSTFYILYVTTMILEPV